MKHDPGKLSLRALFCLLWTDNSGFEEEAHSRGSRSTACSLGGGCGWEVASARSASHSCRSQHESLFPQILGESVLFAVDMLFNDGSLVVF